MWSIEPSSNEITYRGIVHFACRAGSFRQLRRKAETQGLDPNRWFNNVELVASRELGRDTVQYVSNIYKYYLAYQMLTDRTSGRAATTAR